jgi:hypothetical protein
MRGLFRVGGYAVLVGVLYVASGAGLGAVFIGGGYLVGQYVPALGVVLACLGALAYPALGVFAGYDTARRVGGGVLTGAAVGFVPAASSLVGMAVHPLRLPPGVAANPVGMLLGAGYLALPLFAGALGGYLGGRARSANLSRSRKASVST